MDSASGGRVYSAAQINGNESSGGYSQPRPPSGHVGSNTEDNTTHQNMRRGGSKDRGNVTSGIAQIRQNLALPDLQLSHVTVFTDRAELVRTITPVFKAGEIVEMVFENVSSAIEKDSVR